MFPVINDAHGWADYWVLQKGCQALWSGGRRHSPPSVCSITVGKRTLIHTLQIALCEPKSQTIRNMRRSSYQHRDTSCSWRNASLSGSMACGELFALTPFLNISNYDTSWYEASESKNLGSIARFGIFCNIQHVQFENKVENPTSSNLRQEDGVTARLTCVNSLEYNTSLLATTLTASHTR